MKCLTNLEQHFPIETYDWILSSSSVFLNGEFEG